MDKPSNIIDKLRKLLNLAERGGTEEEAATAANMASALALKYGIDLAAVQGATDKPRGFVDAEIFRTDTYEQWVMNLVGGVAQTHNAKAVYRSHGGYVAYCIIVREELVPAARMIVEYMFAAIRRLNRNAVNGRRLSQQGRAEFRAAFRLSASQRLRMRLAQQAADIISKDDVAQRTVGTNALVVQDHFERELKALQEWMADQGYDFKTRKSRGPSITSHEGWEAGRKAGEEIGIDPQLSGTPTGDQAKLIR